MSVSSFVISVGGHQHLGDEETHRFVAEHFRALLLAYQQERAEVLLYAALAAGTDQLFVQIALEVGVRVEIVVPCAEYETIFSSEEERVHYRRLLQAAHATHHLPMQHCSHEAFLAAEHWMIDRSQLAILAWNSLPAQGKSGTADIASYARFVGCPFIQIDTRRRTIHTYGDVATGQRTVQAVSPKHDLVIAHKPVYQGAALQVQQYRVQMPDGNEVLRDVVIRPESLLILPVGQADVVLLIEEYDFGAGAWQLTLPGGKVEPAGKQSLEEQAQRELRQEIGYRAGRLEKLIDLYSHPGYISHEVHVLVASELEWDPLPPEKHEEIRVVTSTLEEALEATCKDHRCDPEAALALWIYAHQREHIGKQSCESDPEAAGSLDLARREDT